MLLKNAKTLKFVIRFNKIFLLGILTIADGLQNIRDYLDQDGAILSGHQEFITYFALPFVSEPHTHPSFKHLFEV